MISPQVFKTDALSTPDDGAKSEYIDDTQWTLKHESILREWKAKCFVNLWLQDRSAYFYSKMYNWFSFPIIIISSLSSAALFATHDQGMKTAVSVMTMLSAVLTAITRQYKPGELHQQHATTTRRYHNLIRHIDTCLSITPQMRPGPELFLEKIGMEIDNLAETQLDPPITIMWQFERKFGPIDRMLYGEDILELMKMNYETNQIFNQMNRTAISTKISLDLKPSPIHEPSMVHGHVFGKGTSSSKNTDISIDIDHMKSLWYKNVSDAMGTPDAHKEPSQERSSDEKNTRSMRLESISSVDNDKTVPLVSMPEVFISIVANDTQSDKPNENQQT